MSEEEMRNIIYLKNKPISSCKDLHKYFIGRHNEPIIVYLTPKFEMDFENNFGKLECLEKENKKYKEVINKAIALLEDDNICADIRRNKPIDDNRGLPFPKCIVEYGVEKELLDILKEVEDD